MAEIVLYVDSQYTQQFNVVESGFAFKPLEFLVCNKTSHYAFLLAKRRQENVPFAQEIHSDKVITVDLTQSAIQIVHTTYLSFCLSISASI